MRMPESIPIVVKPRAAATGMVVAILRELEAALQALIEHGTRHVIDLSAMPLPMCDRQALEAALGEGELRMDLQALGHSRIRESSLPGIWWLRHEGPDGRLLAEHIEVATVPSIVAAHAEDLAPARTRLATLVEQASRGSDA